MVISKETKAGMAVKPEASSVPDAVRVTGHVEGWSVEGYRVTMDGRTLVAEQAVSCLVEPVEGDTVALLETDQGVFITDVLRRPAGPNRTLHLNLNGADGVQQPVTLSAESLSIETKTDIKARGRRLSFRFDDMAFAAHKLTVVGDKLLQILREATSFAKKTIAASETTATVARIRTDQIAEIDQVRAGMRTSETESVSVDRAGAAVIVARDDVRVDGKRISMG